MTTSKRLHRETKQCLLIGIVFGIFAIYNIIASFDSYAWLMLGFFAYCCFVRARGNLKAIEFYKQQTKN